MTTLTYAPEKVTLNVCDYRITGITDVRVTFPQPSFKVVRGNGGRNTRVYNPDTSCTIKVEVLQTSISNYIFSDLVANDKAKNNVRLKVELKDLQGGTTILTTNGFITGTPDFGYSDEIETRGWTIECLDTIAIDLQGNAKKMPDILGNAIGKVGDFVGGLFT